ncbi:hypothetical protein NPIL_367691, partial [Nephila pilipes]
PSGHDCGCCLLRKEILSLSVVKAPKGSKGEDFQVHLRFQVILLEPCRRHREMPPPVWCSSLESRLRITKQLS